MMRRFGGPEVLRVEQVPEPVPGAGQSLVDVALAGVNFDDLERRAGETLPQPLPAVLGVDVVGRRRGDGRRVAALLRRGGGYAQVAVADDVHTIEVPEHIDDAQAVGLLEQGATAYGALVLAGRLRADETVVVSAAAGGVGHLAVQLAVALGAGRVIGLASTSDKRALVTSLGADIALDPADGDIGDHLRESTGGAGADLVVDSVGGALARSALGGLAPFGRLVTIGWRGGDEHGPIRVSTEDLTDRSIGCAGFWMRHVVDNRPLLCGIADELFALTAKGKLAAHIDRVVGLAGTGDAHAAMTARATVGKVLIDVNREL